jgi:hypothetical protein
MNERTRATTKDVMLQTLSEALNAETGPRGTQNCQSRSLAGQASRTHGAFILVPCDRASQDACTLN